MIFFVTFFNIAVVPHHGKGHQQKSYSLCCTWYGPSSTVSRNGHKIWLHDCSLEPWHSKMWLMWGCLCTNKVEVEVWSNTRFLSKKTPMLNSQKTQGALSGPFQGDLFKVFPVPLTLHVRKDDETAPVKPQRNSWPKKGNQVMYKKRLCCTKYDWQRPIGTTGVR